MQPSDKHDETKEDQTEAERRTPTPSLAIRLLGPFRVFVDQQLIEERQWARRKARLLLKLLALQPHHQMHREELMEALWPDLEPGASSANLHKTIHAARRALEPDLHAGSKSKFILTQGQQVILSAPGSVWVDVEAFERQAPEALKNGDVAACEAALALYEGDLLLEDPYEDWAAARRERLRVLRLETLSQLAALYVKRELYDASIASLKTVLTMDEVNEDAHRRLMRLYALTGNRSLAVLQYKRCKEALRRDLDVSPDKATEELHHRIVSGQLQPKEDSGSIGVLKVAEEIREIEESPAKGLLNGKISPTSVAQQRGFGFRFLAVAAIAGVLILIGVLSATLFTRPDYAQTIDSLIILPFNNETGDPGLDYLSDGLTEEMIDRLSKIRELRVIARGTAFRYKERELDYQAIRRDLDVQVLVSGKLIKEGERLIVRAELVDLSNQSQLWAGQYERTLSNISSVHREVAYAVAQRLRAQLSDEEQQNLRRGYSENSGAYQAYLKGRFFWNKRTEEDFKKAVKYFEQAIELDQNYAQAYAGLADCYLVLGGLNITSPTDVIVQAKTAARAALLLDPMVAEAHASLGFIEMQYDKNWSASIKDFEQAINIDPNYATAHHWFAFTLVDLERFDEAIAEIKRARELDPLSIMINTDVASILTYAGRYDEAIEQGHKTVEMDPDFAHAYYILGWAYEQKGIYKESIAALQKAVQLDNRPLRKAILGSAYARFGKRDEALRILEELEAQSRQSYVPPFYLAAIYAELGDRDQAFTYLERANEDRDPGMMVLKIDPAFKSLRSEPRFIDLVRRVGLPQ